MWVCSLSSLQIRDNYIIWGFWIFMSCCFRELHSLGIWMKSMNLVNQRSEKYQLTLTLTLTMENLFLYKSTILLGKKNKQLLLNGTLSKSFFLFKSYLLSCKNEVAMAISQDFCEDSPIHITAYVVINIILQVILFSVLFSLLVICQHKFRGNEAKPPHWHQASVQGKMVIWFQMYSQEFAVSAETCITESEARSLCPKIDFSPLGTWYF